MLQVRDFVLRWYPDGTHAEAIVLGFDSPRTSGQRDGGLVRVALDGNCEDSVSSKDVEFVDRPHQP